MINIENIPTELKHFPNWLVRKGKVPYSPITHKQGNSVSICGTFEQAIQALHGGQ